MGRALEVVVLIHTCSDVSNNNLTGTLPATMTMMANLDVLYVTEPPPAPGARP